MAGDWEDLTLGDLGRIVTGKTPLTAIEGNFGGQIPFVTPSDMDGRRTISTTTRNLTELGAASVKGSKIPAGSVMVSCIGSDMGKTVIAGRDCVTNQQINSIVVDDRFSSEFVYYNLSTRKDEIRHQAAGGSAQPILNKGDFSRLEITLPPLAEQKAIAAVLGALDDKIELNRRMNATLEAIARAIFQSWFIDFDPVCWNLDHNQPSPQPSPTERGRSAAEGEGAPGLDFDPVRAKLDPASRDHPAGLDQATAALFPASFQDSPIGEIPQGWRNGTLGELVELRTDRVDATPAKDGKRYIALEDMPSKSIDISSHQLGSAVNSSITAFRKGDVLFGSMRPYFHKVGLAFFDGITRTTTFVLRPRKDCFRHFALLHFFSNDVVAYSTTASVGTTIPYVKWDSLESYRIPIPPDSLLAAFEQAVSPLVQRIAAQGEESRTLATLRDTLLPKLLSGELSVQGATN